MDYCGRDHHAGPSFRPNGINIGTKQTSKGKRNPVRRLLQPSISTPLTYPSAHLESISSQTPSPTSPSGSSFSSLAPSAAPGQPTSQQIATCQLLFTLLIQPGFSMSLNRLKEALAERGGGAGSTRTLYACVAKKLIKIERGGGEQVVKFDV
jgi:hypothetical protein